ncbi:MAG: hypothetical protein QOJ79_227, partial [Actinomycetota bacterium]|nr:hypothetical protein [Actinomycetota bacterium]
TSGRAYACPAARPLRIVHFRRAEAVAAGSGGLAIGVREVGFADGTRG